MTRHILRLVILIPLLCALPGPAVGQTAEQEATTAALSWLQSYVDAGLYSDAHSRMSNHVHNLIDVNSFVTTMDNFRRPLGGVVSRTLVSRVYKTTLEGMPDGEYVNIEFGTQLVYKASAKELITMKKDLTGWCQLGSGWSRWCALGYSIE